MARNAKAVPYDPDRDEDQELPGFEGLWPVFEGERVTKVVLTFAGEISITDRTVAAELGYLGDVELTVRGKITGKKHSWKAGATVGNATLAIESIEMAGVELDSATAARAAAKAEKAAATPTPIRPDIYPCDRVHRGHLSPCPQPAETCELARLEDNASEAEGADFGDSEPVDIVEDAGE